MSVEAIVATVWITGIVLIVVTDGLWGWLDLDDPEAPPLFLIVLPWPFWLALALVALPFVGLHDLHKKLSKERKALKKAREEEEEE